MKRTTCLLIILVTGMLVSCGALMDTTYLLGDGKTTDLVPASAGTGMSETRIEYEVSSTSAAPGSMLSCYQRTRAVERGWNVTKTYEYRGGYDKSTYTATAIVDGVLAATIGGILTGMCLNEESGVHCANVVWAAPFAVDLVYSLIRRSTVRPKVLVDKSQSSDQMQFGSATNEYVTQCESVSGLFLASVSGPSDEARLNGSGNGGRRELGESAIQLGFDELGAIVLDEQAVNLWASHSAASLWVLEDQEHLRPVVVDRCTFLRPHASAMIGTARTVYDRDCPLPQPSY